jgi:nitroreductase/NAD-dependent dihydropyrimidine dehydrogenase PreA subunit
MITIEVDRKTCKGDGRCVEICPVQILRMNPEQRVPEFIPGGADLCINCGHCFASCPHESIRLSSMSVEQAPPLDHAALPKSEQVELLLKGRRSIRLYKDKPVSKESVEKLLDIARYAPSGINRQPVNWLVIMGKDKVRELSGSVIKWMEELLKSKSSMAQSLRFDRLVEGWNKGQDMICRGAPCVIIAYGLKDDPIAAQSCVISGEYLEIAAFGLGFGACWDGYVSMAINMSEEVRKFIGISSRAQAGAAMMIGYAKYSYPRIPSRNPTQIKWKL